MDKQGETAPHMERDASARGEDGVDIRAEVLSPTGETEGGRASRLGQAQALVARKVNWATLGGAVPVPFLDAAAISGVQLSMLADLSALYERPFDENAARAIVSSLVGGFAPYAAGVGLGGLVAKAVPLLGVGVGVATVSLLARAFTRVLGHLFIVHFESGGAVLDFDPDAMRTHFKREFERAKA
ncbi:YcjF family protein [Rhodospirillum sp. A1_3_36]|uniref:YcjF family protein n=1 Tax=Rhodospirillum sp. A1_3_36 TaxID=3391666 RepID=UPI0039A430CC